MKIADFLITKITPRKLAYSYIIYSVIIGLIFTIFLFAFGYSYIFIKFAITFKFTFTLLAIVLLITLMHTLLFYLITSSLKTMSAFSGLSTIVGTLIWFLVCIYIHIRHLPSYFLTFI